MDLNNLRVWIVLKKQLCSELWKDEFSSMLDLVKDYIVDVWELNIHLLNTHYILYMLTEILQFCSCGYKRGGI